MSYQHVETVRHIEKCVERQDWERLSINLSEDVVYHVPGRNPLSGVHRGVERVVRLYAALAARLEPLQCGSQRVRTWTDERSYISVINRQAIVDGAQIGWTEKNAYFFDEDRVLSCWIFVDNLAAFDAYWSNQPAVILSATTGPAPVTPASAGFQPA